MNTWMNNPQYLAQVSHFLGGVLGVVLATLMTVLFHGGHLPVVLTLILGTIAALIKEYWYDLRYELPKQSLGDSTMDFLFYCFGMLVGGGVAAFSFAHLPY